MAELHIIGRLRGAEDFKERALFCKWALQCGSGWRIIAGQTDGQTQVDRCQQPLDTATWCHPIDLLIVCRGLQGWPRIVVQVYREDWYGRRDLCGYGVATIPSTPGHHTVTCHTWRPTGTFLEELRREFVGGGPQILSTDYIFSASERYKLRTAPAGKVILDLGIIMRGFDKHGVMS
ncbi:B9 domain-containing protein 2 [Hyalella azteca]|uniref:B9 domain-containing protein 2 n=1 Tax=Hyalella azteca TaxID=294128 RepID=A0A8B7NB81_HYAAZ|nr:B9 domain-containing protein 2 [Hyalella azteca]